MYMCRGVMNIFIYYKIARSFTNVHTRGYTNSSASATTFKKIKIDITKAFYNNFIITKINSCGSSGRISHRVGALRRVYHSCVT